MKRTRIALVAPDAWTLWLFYRQLIEALQKKGAEITAFSAADDTISRLTALNVKHVTVPYARFISPASDVRLFWSLHRAFRDQAFDIVQNFTVKANLYGGLAASLAGIPRIFNTVEGSGILYGDHPEPRLRMIRAMVEVGLRWIRPRVTTYWFVNDRDRALFVDRGLATFGRSVAMIATGVDTRLFDQFSVPAEATTALRTQLGVSPDLPLVTLVAGRLLRSKGVEEFIELARGLRSGGVPAQAVLVGPHEPGNLDAIDRSVVEKAIADGSIRWIPFREDVWTVYAASEVVIVPTYYAEGTPKGVLESMSMGRALICSDLPSTRPLVHDQSDAILVPPRDVGALVRAVASLLRDPARRSAMGTAARQTALKNFDADLVAQEGVKRVYGSFPGEPS